MAKKHMLISQSVLQRSLLRCFELKTTSQQHCPPKNKQLRHFSLWRLPSVLWRQSLQLKPLMTETVSLWTQSMGNTTLLLYLMTETVSLWTISIVSKDKERNRYCCIPQSMGNKTEERESERER